MNIKVRFKNELTQIQGLQINMSSKKVLLNKDLKEDSEAKAKGGQGKTTQGPANIPINNIKFNQNEYFQKQFMSVDELGRLAIWDSKNGKKIAEEKEVTNGLLMALDVEEKEGKLVACGGIDTMLHIF
mmetsp:Transcript_31397/g.30747  ORF Transcript_31397/g.30747 Transcript_31397/m.30747 type:complete len:128 (+) Transcript_31397:123-506(+)